MSEWHHISTAPGNENIIVWDSYRNMVVLAWRSPKTGKWLDPFDANHHFLPSHWRPLPNPPGASETKEVRDGD